MSKLSTPLTNVSALLLLAVVAAPLGGCNDDGISVVQETIPPQPTPPAVTPSPTPWLEKHLTITPANLDFGAVALRCQEIKEIRIYNDSVQDVRIFGIAPAGGTSDEFAATVYNNLTLAPFENLAVPIAYTPVDPGIDSGVLLVQSDVPSQPNFSVGLSGQDGGGGERADSFIQPPGTPVDFIWLLDISGSMGGETDQVIENFDRFIQELAPLDIDYQMALITTSMSDEGDFQGNYGTEAEPVPWITFDMGSEGIEAFTNQMYLSSRGSSTDERGLDSLMLSLSEDKIATKHKGFLRPDARLVITVFSDEDDHSLQSPGSVIGRLNTLKPNADIIFNSVVGTTQVSESSCHTETGDRYIDISNYYSGYIENVCLGSYSNLMATIGEYAAASDSSFPLSGAPEVAYGFRVFITPEGGTPEEVTSGWSYDETTNSIAFEPEAVPPAGAKIEIEYTEAGLCL